MGAGRPHEASDIDLVALTLEVAGVRSKDSVAVASRRASFLLGRLSEIHLTGIVLLAPYLTPENHREVLARARYRRKREIELLVAELAPAREVPALIEPLAARAGARSPLHGGWAAVAQSQAGWVRQLEPGDGRTRAPSAPEDWHDELVGELGTEAVSAPERPAQQEIDAEVASAPERQEPADGERRAASVRSRVQFTADQAYVDLLEQARALLWHRLPSGERG